MEGDTLVDKDKRYKILMKVVMRLAVDLGMTLEQVEALILDEVLYEEETNEEQ